MRVLNLSLDLFLDPISRWAGSGQTRLSDDYYYVWKPETVRAFLEQRCRLSAKAPTPGVVVDGHEDAFSVWRSWIERGELSAPFELILLDAHSNLGGGDAGWFYVLGRLLHLPVERRAEADLKKVTPENYLLFALACRWLESITLVTHPDWDNDVLRILYQDADPESGNLQLRRFDSRLLEQAMEYGVDLPEPVGFEDPVPFRVMGSGDYRETRPYDRIVFSRSANFTPKDADVLIPVIERYIAEG